ncbi:MAG TPA: hypothetical protein VEQ60_03570 [Longimicrobium sp.]|nr:hypothetical protein [Longimicrobium sp.]
MTKRPIRLGELLVQMGRVTPDEVERALVHQREHGGYVGDSLVALGILTRDELWWGLADQHGLPFVHLRAEHIDHALAARVPAAWAREHSVLPVLWDEGRVTVVMRELAGLEMLDEVRLLTGASEVVPALSSPEAIAELIDAVHGDATPLGVEALLAEALARGATALGVSVRPGRATGWYLAGDLVSRALGPAWRAELGAVVEPAFAEVGGPVGAPARWSATARAGSELRMLECSAVGKGDVLEWAAVPGERMDADPARMQADAALVQRAREARRGAGLAARIECDAGAARAAEALLTLLPARVLGDAVRALHLADRTAAVPPGTLVILVDGPLAATAAGLQPFAPDAVTVRVDALGQDDLAALRRLAPFVAVLAGSGPGPAPAFDCVVRLGLDAGGPAWTLVD